VDLISVLPPLQAALNMTAACLAGAAFFFVRRGNRTAHKTLMITALIVSSVFLVFYLHYHYQVGNIPFAGQGAIRPIYFSILASHVVLAVIMVPMILAAVIFAVQGRFDRHRRIARWTLLVWVYVSVTGVLIYLLAFQIYPPAPGGVG
jgi:putative membrane protein